MSSVAAWTRPSILLLGAILVANLTLPLVHFWPAPTSGGNAAPGRHVPAPGRSTMAGRSSSATKAVAGDAGFPGPAGSADAAPPIEPVQVPAVPRRPAPAGDGSAPPAQVCRAWGPFAEPAEAEALLARLGLPEEHARVHARQEPSPADYLVTVRAGGSLAAVRRTMNELERRSVESHRLDRPGNILAVGVFSDPVRAESQRRRMAELGYEAEVELLERSRTVYHLLARTAADFEAEVPAAGVCGDIAPTHRFL